MHLLLGLILAQAAGPDVSGAARKEVDRQFCKQGDRSEIIVCGKRDRNERYRMPDRDAPFDPDGDQASVMRERGSWIEGGETGAESCGPVGPAGFTGCMAKAWERERQQSAWGKNRARKW